MAFLIVDGVELPCPSSCDWGLQDVSAADAGRTQDTIMHKNRVAQKRKLSVSWNAPDKDTASKILKAVNPEYIQVTYHDVMDNEAQTRTFYVGDRSAPFKFWWIGNQRFESISFDLIER